MSGRSFCDAIHGRFGIFSICGCPHCLAKAHIVMDEQTPGGFRSVDVTTANAALESVLPPELGRLRATALLSASLQCTAAGRDLRPYRHRADRKRWDGDGRTIRSAAFCARIEKVFGTCKRRYGYALAWLGQCGPAASVALSWGGWPVGRGLGVLDSYEPAVSGLPLSDRPRLFCRRRARGHPARGHPVGRPLVSAVCRQLPGPGTHAGGPVR
jgi:hypothetical protein